MKRKLLVLALILGLALSLCGCGEIPKGAGTYNCVGYSYKGVPIIDDSFGENGAFITLSPHGRGIFSYEGQSGLIKWLSGGEYIEISIDGKSYEGSLKNGIIELGFSDELHAFFRWDQLPEEKNQELSARYYGWWQIKEPQGNLPETWMDCCAEISLKSGQPELIIWDEDGSAQKPMGRARLQEKDGVLSNLDGDFWYMPLEEGEWVLDFDAEQFPNMLKLSGNSIDSEGQSFKYTICLRPWGQDWSDVEEKKPSMLPFYYNEWYKPLIEKGESMPEEIMGEK